MNLPQIGPPAIHLADADGTDCPVGERELAPHDPWDNPYWGKPNNDTGGEFI